MILLIFFFLKKKKIFFFFFFFLFFFFFFFFFFKFFFFFFFFFFCVYKCFYFQSTACIAGALALYMEATQSKNSQYARDMLTIYAKPIYDAKNEEKASVLQQGAGLINVYNSIISSTLVTPTKILLKDT